MMPPASTWYRRSVPTLSGLVVLGGLLLWEILRILALNNGLFVYTLDDPYIHLALAENLQNGWYGINVGEFAAPSSSILWPVLLIPGADWILTPLAINLVAAVATVVVVARIVAQAQQMSTLLQSIVVAALVLATNLVGLVLTGMEHTLQVFTVASTVLGLLLLEREGRLAWWLPVALVASVAVRYEDLAVALPAIVLLWRWGRSRAALTSALGVILVVGSFSVFLMWHGHAPLPSSVAAKSSLVGASSISPLLHHVAQSLAQRQGVIVWALLLMHVVLALRSEPSARSTALHAAVAAAMGLHVLGGQYGWLDRYEIYILTIGLLTLIEPVGRGLATLRQHRGRWRRWVGTAVPLAALGVIGAPYVKGLTELPHASQNIYLQQYQMHRFATEYWKRPIAVNDLGYVAYGNDAYVLDLWGLGSQQALQLRRANTDRSWVTSIASSHNVRLAMIYNDWVGPLPAPWKSVATMRFSVPLVSAARDSVNFYVQVGNDPDGLLETEVRGLLQSFRYTLPAQASLTIVE